MVFTRSIKLELRSLSIETKKEESGEILARTCSAGAGRMTSVLVEQIGVEDENFIY